MSPEQIAELRRQKYNATVVRLARAHPDLLTMRVRPDFPVPAHQPGQYTALGLGNWEPRAPGCQEEGLPPAEWARLARRSYSISCPVLDDRGELLGPDPGWLEFYVVLVRESGKERPPALTPRLFLLAEGDRLFLGEKIAGHFTLAGVAPDDTVVFLATGTGEAPHNYMLWQLLRAGHRGRILSACCVRYARDLAYRSTHERLMARFANYTYLSLTTREPGDLGRKVYLQGLITGGELERRLGQPLDPARTHVFLCGNPAMIGVPARDRQTGALVYPRPPGVIEILARRGFQPDVPARKLRGNVHYEEYW
jgi:ferredoxin/flavodoxin---NADP+ reductase